MSNSLVLNWKLFFLFLNQTYVVGTQKNRLIDGSFEHPKHMFKLMDKEIIAILSWKSLLNWTYDPLVYERSKKYNFYSEIMTCDPSIYTMDLPKSIVSNQKEELISLWNSLFCSCVLFQVCAIIGGTFTVAGILDSLIFSASEIVKKVQLGKLTWET